MKAIVLKAKALLEAYAPVAFMLMAIPILLYVDPGIRLRLMLVSVVFPGLLLTILNPGLIKQPVSIFTLLFVVYFSAQHIRGMDTVSFDFLKNTLIVAALIYFPVQLISNTTTERKLYPIAMSITMVAATLSVLLAMISFYSTYPFPTSRYTYGYNSTAGSRIVAYFAVLAGAYFLQTGQSIKKTDWVALLCLPILLLAVYYSHSRGTAMALFATACGIFLTLRSRTRKSLILFSILGATFLLYTGTMIFAPVLDKIQRSDPVPEKHMYLHRPGGLSFSTNEENVITRFAIWKDHIQRMNSPATWIFGQGLGLKCFAQENEFDHDLIEVYYKTSNGYQLFAHSGYVWALYHGGLIGLALLILLMGSTGLAAARAGPPGYVAAALLAYCFFALLTCNQRLLAGAGEAEYLLLWGSVSLSAGLNKKESAE